VGAGNSSLHHCLQNSSGALPSFLSNGYQGLFPWGYVADHSPPSSAKVKECVELYLHSPIRICATVLSEKYRVGVKQPGHEAGPTPPSNAEVKNALSYTSTSLSPNGIELS